MGLLLERQACTADASLLYDTTHSTVGQRHCEAGSSEARFAPLCVGSSDFKVMAWRHGGPKARPLLGLALSQLLHDVYGMGRSPMLGI